MLGPVLRPLEVLQIQQARLPDRTHTQAASMAEATNCTAFILVPHSLHSYASVETYALGYPLLVPSPDLLADWHFMYSLVMHRCANNEPFTTPPPREDSPNSMNRTVMKDWFGLADFYSWPGVVIFDDPYRLRRLVSTTSHNRRPEQSRYMRAAAAEAAPRLEAGLYRAIAHGRWLARERSPRRAHGRSGGRVRVRDSTKRLDTMYRS